VVTDKSSPYRGLLQTVGEHELGSSIKLLGKRTTEKYTISAKRNSNRK